MEVLRWFYCWVLKGILQPWVVSRGLWPEWRWVILEGVTKKLGKSNLVGSLAIRKVFGDLGVREGLSLLCVFITQNRLPACTSSPWINPVLASTTVLGGLHPQEHPGIHPAQRSNIWRDSSSSTVSHKQREHLCCWPGKARSCSSLYLSSRKAETCHVILQSGEKGCGCGLCNCGSHSKGLKK